MFRYSPGDPTRVATTNEIGRIPKDIAPTDFISRWRLGGKRAWVENELSRIGISLPIERGFLGLLPLFARIQRTFHVGSPGAPHYAGIDDQRLIVELRKPVTTMNQAETPQMSPLEWRNSLKKKPSPTTARYIISILKPLGISLAYDCHHNPTGFHVNPQFGSEWVGVLNHFFGFSNDKLRAFVTKFEPTLNWKNLISERDYYSDNISKVANDLRLLIPEVIKTLVEDYPDKVMSCPQSKSMIAAYRQITNGSCREGEPEWPERLFFRNGK
jgi:hypothetical protein